MEEGKGQSVGDLDEDDDLEEEVKVKVKEEGEDVVAAEIGEAQLQGLEHSGLWALC